MAGTPAAPAGKPKRKKPTREEALAAGDTQRKQEQENSHKALVAEPYTCQVCLTSVPEPAATGSFPIKFHICEHKACSTCWFELEKSKRDKCAGSIVSAVIIENVVFVL